MFLLPLLSRVFREKLARSAAHWWTPPGFEISESDTSATK